MGKEQGGGISIHGHISILFALSRNLSKSVQNSGKLEIQNYCLKREFPMLFLASTG